MVSRGLFVEGPSKEQTHTHTGTLSMSFSIDIRR